MHANLIYKVNIVFLIKHCNCLCRMCKTIRRKTFCYMFAEQVTFTIYNSAEYGMNLLPIALDAKIWNCAL